MKTPDPLETELTEFARTNGEALDATTPSRLARLLRADSLNHARSDAHQAWAWTRLQARLQEERTRRQSPLASLQQWLYPVCGMTLAGFASLLLIWHNHNSLSEVQALTPSIYASTFYSPEAKADVVWATGYDYEPGDQPGANP